MELLSSDPLTLILFGILVYWLGVLVLRRQGLIPEYIRAQGPLLSIHTRRGRALLERLARPKRLWRAWANFGVGVTLVVMALAFIFLLLSAISQMQQPESTVVTQPQNVLVIPGVNQFLPLSVAGEILFGLLVGLVVHEGGHGLLCRVENIDIKSLGIILLAFIPLGAFVEPDEESRREANRGGQVRMFAAGVTNNFAVTIVAFALLFGPVAGSIGVASGMHVGQTIPGSAADQAGILKGDRVTAVNGIEVSDNDELDAVLANISEQEVAVEVNDDRIVDVERSLLVTRAVANGPADLKPEDTIVAVDGTSVGTTQQFRQALAGKTFATLETADGNTTTTPIGAYVRVAPNNPLAAAGAPAGENVVITAIDGEQVLGSTELSAILDGTSPGETVTVSAVVDGSTEQWQVELAEGGDGNGFLGVNVFPGVSGVVVSDFGVRAYPSEAYLSILGGAGSDRGFIQRAFFVLVLPIAGVANIGLPFNFAGFTGGIGNFYTVMGPLGFLGGWLLLLANLLFWTGWINFNLAFFNCIPGYPLDGGHILRNATEAVVSRLPVSDPRRATRVVTTTVGLTMLTSLILLLFGQGLLVG